MKFCFPAQKAYLAIRTEKPVHIRLNLRRYFDFGPKKSCQITPLSRKFDFPTITVNNSSKFSTQESYLAPFLRNGTKVKIL